jgi:hypothetical protein
MCKEYTVSQDAMNNMKKRTARLYEQGADAVSIGQYVLRWVRWVKAGVVDLLGYPAPVLNVYIPKHIGYIT